MSAEEQNKALVRREQEELWNHIGNLHASEGLFTPDYAEDARQGLQISAAASRTW
jgi:hypothetical protein